MERLWTPWRFSYVSGAGGPKRKGVPPELDRWPAGEDKHCVFCNMIASVEWAIADGMAVDEAERAALILSREDRCFVCLNRFPYSSGHVLIVPYDHVSSLAQLPEQTASAMMLLARRVDMALRGAYQPEGINLGMNLGEAAGAGVAEHIHMHALPRWIGDTNFMSVIGETRVLPEELHVTWEKLRRQLTCATAGPNAPSELT